MSWEQRSIPGRREGRSDCIREKNRMASSLSCDVCFEQFTGGTRLVEMVIMNKDIGWNGEETLFPRNKYTRFSPQQQKDIGIFMRNTNLVGSNLHYYALKRKIECPFEEKTVLVIFRAPRPCSVWVGGGVVAQRLILEHLKHTSIKFKTLRSFPKFKYNSKNGVQ